MNRLLALCLGLSLVVGATAASDQPPGVDPHDFVAYDAKVLALTGARLIDGTGAAPRAHVTVLIRDGRIAAVGDDGSVAIPAEARRIDLAGKTLLPGYVMLHEHLFYPTGRLSYASMPYSFPRLYLAGGVTTMRTAGSINPYADLGIKQWIDAGRAVGPHIFFTGPYLTAASPEFPIMQVPDFGTPRSAREEVRHWIDLGARDFKTYTTISRKTLKAVIDEAHAHGARVTGHLCSVTLAEAAALGIDDLEHGVFVATDFVKDKQPDRCPPYAEVAKSIAALDVQGPQAQALIRTLVARRVALTSTLPVFEAFTPGRPPLPAGVLDLMSAQARDNYLRAYAAVTAGHSQTAIDAFKHGMAFEKAFLDAGGLLVSGTDPTGNGGVVPGYSNAREVELLVEAGLTLPQAVQVATLNGAKFLHIDGETGSVAVGKRADLSVIDGDPTHDPRALRKVQWVFKDGIGYDAAKLRDSVRGDVGTR
ncbi:amidohydrolase [Mizugakiibacter sediminis]|uniref:Amidohydrolase n=1 Tax=Mizugakiibacter sediminis TaxID=1475481 RepID=A0A0K8QMX5_9GAMM|nr:amidohydrolase family protein [Mizugakiibacter sediminis]GAP65782.1 amidohydrolase [Mizugakiibacter sediminis]